MAEREMRVFESGATRDGEADKFDYAGFNSPLVEQRFAAYMHLHRKQADGSMRGSDNWKAGIPIDAYKRSIARHWLDLWLHLEGQGHAAMDPDIESVLCALRFNVNGMLFEHIVEREG